MSGAVAGLAAIVFLVVVLAVFLAGAFVPDRPAEPGRDDGLVLLIYAAPVAIFLSGLAAIVAVALWIAGPVESW